MIPLVLFWIFSTLPRLWFLLRGAPREPFFLLLGVLLIGVLRDALLFTCLALPLLALKEKIRRWPRPLFIGAMGMSVLALAATLACMMVDIEFMHIFGSHANFDHVSMLMEPESGHLFLTNAFSKWMVFIEVGVVPLTFVVLTFTWRGLRVKQFFNSRNGLVVTACLFFIGLAAHYIPIKDPLMSNLADNFVITVSESVVLGDESGITGGRAEPIQKLLDTMPLASANHKDPTWYYVDPNYPLVKATDHQLCQMGLWKGAQCDVDNDKDGVPLSRDCNDADPAVHPGAVDIPGNGIDEDCSGIDADPPNIILIHWEGARAVNVGSIGYAFPSTPRFDELVKKSGRLFRNAYTNGTQTRFSLISMYASILPRLSTKWIFQHNPELNVLSLPAILRTRGYQTIYVHSGDTNFASLYARMVQWFEQVYDRNTPPIRNIKKVGWGIPDRELFGVCYDLLKQRKDQRPFFMAIATLSLHYPFLLADPKFEIKKPHSYGENHIPNILRYSDDAMGNFLQKILTEPEFKNTIIVIAADHGLNHYAPHRTNVQNEMWEDLVWIPMALVGKKWNIPVGVDDRVHQLADIPPTILDRLGILVPNPFIGHSLLRNYDDRTSRAWFSNSNGGLSAGLRENQFKYRVHLGTGRESLFDLSKDREEKNNLADDPQYKSLIKRFNSMLIDVYTQNSRLIKKNRIWDWKFWVSSESKTKN